MPRDLFGAVVSRPPSVRSRRVTIVSVVVHTLAISTAVAVSLVGSDTLPMPRQVLAYYEMPIRLADVSLPPPPPKQRENVAPDRSVLPVNPDLAPVVAPEGISPESGIEHMVSTEREVGIINGFGDPSGILTGSGLREEPPPLPPPPEPVRLHSGIRAPLKVTHVPPIYPAIAQQARVQGIVILEATIDSQGTVVSATVLKSIQLLDAAALEAVRQWKFTPALLNGIPVPVIMTVTVRFTLQ